MTDIATFPTIQKVMENNGPTWTFIAGEAITAGQVVGFAASGTSNTIVAMDETSGENPIGVAIYDIASGSRGAIALAGSIVNLANADDTTTIDAGNYVETNNNAVKGTVSEYAPRAARAAIAIDADDTITWTTTNVVGKALEDIAGGAYGPVLLCPYLELSSVLTVVT